MDGQKAQLDIERHDGGEIMLITVIEKSVNFGKNWNMETQVKKRKVSRKARKAVYQAKYI